MQSTAGATVVVVVVVVVVVGTGAGVHAANNVTDAAIRATRSEPCFLICFRLFVGRLITTNGR
ncbi:unannotated protein [freshwater metagenome]|uniref:Unannotated protein n=1 Tax=freshwater metagenome TaxID=449393 RepID=A0A6J7UW89_9ZZZZ